MNKNLIIFSTLFIIQLPLFTQTLNQKMKLAQQLESNGRLNEARQLYEQMAEEQPNNLIVFNRLKTLYLDLHEYEQARTWIETRMIEFPDQPDLKIYLGQVFFRLGDDKRAYQIWDNVIHAHEKEQHVYHVLSSILIQERLIDRAIETYLKGRKTADKPNLYAINLANLYLTNRDYEKSMTEYLAYSLQYPKQIRYIESQIARFPVHASVLDRIEKPLRAALDKTSTPEELKMLLVKLYIRHGHFGKALKYSGQIDEAQNDSLVQGRALFGFAKEAFSQGAVEEAKSAYGKIITSYPQFNGIDQALLGLAKCEESHARYDEAVRAHRALLDTPASLNLIHESWLKIGLLQRDKLNRIDEAVATYQAFLNTYPRGEAAFRARLELGRCHTLKGNLNKAEMQFRECLAHSPQTPEHIHAAFYLAQVLYFKKHPEQALSLLDSLAGLKMSMPEFQHPSMNDALKLRLFIQIWQREDPVALQHFSAADLLIMQRKFHPAQSALDSLILIRNQSPVAAEAWFRKGAVAEFQSDPNRAIRYYSTVSDSFPQSFLADMALAKCGNVYEMKNKPGDAIFTYEKLLTTYPQSLLTPEIRKRLRLLREQS